MILEPGRYCKDSDVGVQLVEETLEPGGDVREDETEGRLEDDSTTIDSSDVREEFSFFFLNIFLDCIQPYGYKMLS